MTHHNKHVNRARDREKERERERERETHTHRVRNTQEKKLNTKSIKSFGE